MPHHLDLAVPFYLDAGTGSMLVQMAVAGVAGVAVFAKLFWTRITGPFRRKRSDEAVVAEADPAQQSHHQTADD